MCWKETISSTKPPLITVIERMVRGSMHDFGISHPIRRFSTPASAAAGVLVSGLVCGGGFQPPLLRSGSRSRRPIACSTVRIEPIWSDNGGLSPTRCGLGNIYLRLKRRSIPAAETGASLEHAMCMTRRGTTASWHCPESRLDTPDVIGSGRFQIAAD